MYRKRYKRKRKKKRFVEIKTNKRGWYKVQLIKFLSGNRVLLKLPSGEIMARGTMNLRWGVAKKVIGASRPSTKSGRKFRTKKKMRRYKQKGKKVTKKWQRKGVRKSGSKRPILKKEHLRSGVRHVGMGV